jgi:RHS repeat-associated protein
MHTFIPTLSSTRRIGPTCAAVLALVLALASSARAQSVGTNRDHFTINGEAKFLTFLSYFDAMRSTDANLAADLSFIKNEAGFDGIRIFPNWWHYSGSPANCPSAASDTLFTNTGAIRGDNGDGFAPSGRLLALIKLLRAAQAQGLIVDISFTRETVGAPGELDVAEYTTAITKAAVLLREYRNVLFDIQNERDNGGLNQSLTYQQVLAITQAIRAVDQTRVVVASMGGAISTIHTGSLESPNALSVTGFNQLARTKAIAYHDPRGPNWYSNTTAAVAQLRQGNDPAHPEWWRPAYLQEPTRWRMPTNACGVTETTEQSDPDPQHFRTALQLAKQAGAAAWTFHTHRAFRLPATGPLHQQLASMPAAERDLYVGPTRLTLTATTPTTTWGVTVPLRVQVTGPGRVDVSPGGIQCTSAGGSACVASYVPGTLVTLRTYPDTVPNATARFEGYDLLSAVASEPCGLTADCTIRILAPTEVGARFGLVPLQTTEYIHTDAVGSIRAVSNAAGTLVVSNNFLPFGERDPVGTANPLTTRRLFAGKERDAETDYDYFGARYLASRSARFTSVDPVLDLEKALADPQRWNRYAYALNNPLRNVDPDGREPITTGVAVGIAWVIYEVGSQIYDGYETYRTWTDPNSSGWERAVTTGGFAAGALLPGGGYGTAGKAAVRHGGKLVDAAEGGYHSFAAFKRAMGPAGDFMDWHHIVAQAKNVAQFGADVIHNPKNLAAIPRDLHRKITGFMNSKQPFTNGLTVREWLQKQSLEEQWNYGRRLMEKLKKELKDEGKSQ